MDVVASDLSIREEILAAALERLRHYGYNKTTMAEIAGDCGMSAANLYRYFQNKQDIAAQLAARCLREEEVRLQAVVDASDLGAGARLQRYIAETLACTCERCGSDPLINQLVEAIGRERRDVIDAHAKVKLGQLAALLEAGVTAGEFDAINVRETAEAILASTALFDVPLLVQMYPRADLERAAAAVARMVLRAVESRGLPAPPRTRTQRMTRISHDAI